MATKEPMKNQVYQYEVQYEGEKRCKKISSYSLIRTVDNGLLYCLLAKVHSSGPLEPWRVNSRSTSQTASSVRFLLGFLYVESAMAFKQYARDKSKIMTW